MGSMCPPIHCHLLWCFPCFSSRQELGNGRYAGIGAVLVHDERSKLRDRVFALEHCVRGSVMNAYTQVCNVHSSHAGSECGGSKLRVNGCGITVAG